MNSQLKKGAILSYINIFVKNIIAFLYVPILLKYIGQSDYGLFQMTNSLVVSLSILSMGLTSAYVKFYFNYKVKEDYESIKKLNGLYLIVFILIGALTVLIGLFFINYTESIFNRSFNERELIITEKLLLLMTLNLALTFPSSVFDSFILVNERFVFQQLRIFMQTILVPIIAIPIVIIKKDVTVISLVQLCITFLYLLLNTRFCINKLHMKFKFTWSAKNMLWPLLTFSGFILLNQIVDMINNNIPSFILGIVVGPVEVAIFAIAVQIKNMFFMLSTSVSSVFVPRVNKIVNEDRNPIPVLLNLMIRVGRIQLVILLFFLGGFISVGQYFINVWAGPKNLPAYLIVILMVFPALVPLSQNIGIEIQRAMNKHIFRSVTYSIFAVVNLLITYLGARKYGAIGASLGYSISMIVANGLLMNWYYHKKIGIDMIEYWKKVTNLFIPFFVSIILSFIIQKFIPSDKIITFIVNGILYVVIFFVCYLFVSNKEEKNILRNILKR